MTHVLEISAHRETVSSPSITHKQVRHVSPQLLHATSLATSSFLSRLLSLMSPHQDVFGHATDWKASAAERASARRSSLPAIMGSTAVDMLLGDCRTWHDR
jgi:hypothetical protein